MSYPIYYVPAGDVLPIFFSTYDGGTGASLTMSGLAVTDIEIYKDGGTTQRASDAGYTLLDTDGIDFDGITGIHGFSIDTGDNTDAGFYTVGAWYHVVVSSVTVDAQTVNFIAAAFRIMAAEDSAGVPDVNVTHFGGSAGTFASGRPEVNTTLIEGVDATNQIRDSVVDDATRIDASALNTLSGHDPGEPIMGATDLGTGAGLTTLATQASVNTIDDFLDTEIAAILAAVDTEVAAILADTNELQTDWANGGRLDLILDARASQASVDDLPTNAELSTALGTADDAVLAAVATVDGNVDAIKAKTDSLTFTVAGQVDANIESVNATAITGDGQTGTEWGPA